MNKNTKTIAIVAAGALAAYLLYEHYAGTSSTTSGTATDPTSSDYAALAGQEQSDVAGLQGQEQSDVAALEQQLQGLLGGPTSADLAALQGQEQQDIAGLAAQIAGLSPAPTSVAAAATGTTKHKRTTKKMHGRKTTAAHKAGKARRGAHKVVVGGLTGGHGTTSRAQQGGHVNHNYSPHPTAGRHGNPSVAPAHHGPKKSTTRPHHVHGRR